VSQLVGVIGEVDLGDESKREKLLQRTQTILEKVFHGLIGYKILADGTTCRGKEISKTP
jgi:hypothetical protein